MIISELELYEMLRPKLGETEAKALVSTIEANQKVQEIKHQTIEKELVGVKKDITHIQDEQKTLATKADLKADIAELKAEIVRWIAIIAGVLLTGIKLIPSAPWA